MPPAVKALWDSYGRIIRFIISGGTGAAVNLSVLAVLVEYFGWYAVYGSIGSFVCAFFVSFSLQKLWTYKNYNKEAAGMQMAIYLGIQLVNLGINTGLMYFFIEYTPLHYLAAQIITLGLIAVESYFLYTHVVFKEQNSKTQAV
jgi:putative flippase GtrA